MTECETIRFIDLFGGIGGFRHGLEQASNRFKCVDYIEYDKYAVKSYNAIFKEEHEPRDVTQLSKSEIRDHDLLCAGFPCQSFSVAGNRQGTDEARGKLFREIVRIAEAKRPEMLLLENVKGILSQKVVQDGESIKGTKGYAFTEVLQAFHELGYCLEWQVLNSKNWGVPQNRERVFIIGHLGGEPRRKVFPIRRKDRGNTEEDGQELEINEIGSRYGKQSGGVYDREGVFPTVQYGKRGPQPHHVTEEGLNTTEDDASYCIDSNYMKGTSPGDIGSGRRTQIINHQFRPESRPSVEEEGQSGGSGLLYNSDYSTALSNSPHHCIDLRDKNRGSHEKLLENSPTLRSQRHGIAVWDDYNSNMRKDGNTGTLTKNFGTDATRNGNKIVQIPHGENDGGEHDTCPNFSSSSWHENNFLKEVQPVHTPDFTEKDMNMKSSVGSEDGSIFTVTSSSQHGVTDKKRIRKLTPKECWRLQGFPEQSFEAAQEVNSDTQLYKQAGNAVTVNVIKALGEEIQVYFGKTKND